MAALIPDKSTDRTPYPKIFAISLGCPKNRVDTEYAIGSILDLCTKARLVADPHEADILIVNTCGFIRDAVEESIDTILELCDIKTEKQKIIVLGCMVERFSDELSAEIPEVDLWGGTPGSYRIDSMLLRLGLIEEIPCGKQNIVSRIVSTPPWRAYLKVADGCSNRCTYCLIPRLRGPYRSSDFMELIDESRRLCDQGVKELTLVAQDLTAYQWDGTDLPGLVTAISRETDLDWIRLMYLHPGKITEDLLKAIADNPSVCRYLDIPIQHASNRILKLMGRGYSLTDIDNLVSKIRSIIPDASLRTTVMVGFPGESNDDFEILKEMIQKWQFDHVGCFTYSDESEAASHKMGHKVPGEIAKSRQNEIMTIQSRISEDKNRRFLGRTMKVLVEGTCEETELLLAGRSQHQGPEVDGTIYINEGFCNAGEFVTVKIIDSYQYDLVGKIVS